MVILMTDYIFKGEVIKLNNKHYTQWQEKFKYLNLWEELETLDMEFEARQMEGKKVKNWFSECIPRLNGRNKRAEQNYIRNNNRFSSLPGSVKATREMTLDDESSRSWALDKH